MNNDECKNSENNDITDSDYLNQLANEADDIFNVKEDETDINYSDDVDTIDQNSEYDGYIEQEDDKPHYRMRFRPNKGLLFIGIFIMLVTLLVMINKAESEAPRTNRNEAVNPNVNETVTDSVNVTTEFITFEEEAENYTEDGAMNDMYLTNIPVVVTEEVDVYFKDTIDYLKLALKIDEFIASNELYGNTELCGAYKKLVDDFNIELEKWNTRNVPEGCEEYDSMIGKSLSAYQYYFTEVAAACDLETKDEYRNKLQAAVAYVQTTVDYSATAEDYSPVFYYYGLYE